MSCGVVVRLGSVQFLALVRSAVEMAQSDLPCPGRRSSISRFGRLRSGARQFGPRCGARILAFTLLPRDSRASVCVCSDSVSPVSGDTTSRRLRMSQMSPNFSVERMAAGMVGLVRSRSLGLRPAPSRILFGASQAPQIFVDVQTDIMHFFVHGCLVSFIDDESGTACASHMADRSPPGDNPRNYTGIKHPLNFFVKP